MRTYTQLTREQRYQIYALLKMGHEQTEIVGVIGVHKSSVSREIHRNRGRRGYRPRQAQQWSIERRAKPRGKISFEDWTVVEGLIREDWSPEQVSEWLKIHSDVRVSHEWIYQHILADKRVGGILFHHLRCQKKRHKRYGSYEKRGIIPNRVNIDERPQVVDGRERLGDWEVDTITGKRHKQVIVTLTERKSRLALCHKVEHKSAEAVKGAIVKMLEPWKEKTHTITSDNGKEFALHQQIAETLDARFFFAHPYAAWERGSNENMNGLLRQYFPKKANLEIVTDNQIQFTVNRLNNRPRKCLAYKTPLEVFLDHPVALET